MTAMESRSRFVEHGRLRLHTLSYGDSGGDLLILPGITSPAAVWEFVAAPLARRHRVHVTDLRGRGYSAAPPGSTFTLADYAGDVVAVIASLGLERPLILGHSLGARVAAALAVEHPQLVDRLMLVEPPLSGPGREPYPTPLAFYLDAIAAAREPGAVELIRRDHPAWSDEQLRARARWLPTCDKCAVAETHRNFHVEDFLPFWEALPSPFLVSGSESPVVPPARVAELMARNASARSVVVKGAGHMIPWDQSERFLAVVEEAFETLASDVVR
jgi:N-formylmaleamate deformylase